MDGEGVNNALSEGHQPVAASQRDDRFRVMGRFAKTEYRPSLIQAGHLVGIGANQKRCVVAGVDIAKKPSLRAEFGIEAAYGAAGGAAIVDQLVHAFGRQNGIRISLQQTAPPIVPNA
jgi:hypothetical protein